MENGFDKNHKVGSKVEAPGNRMDGKVDRMLYFLIGIFVVKGGLDIYFQLQKPKQQQELCSFSFLFSLSVLGEYLGMVWTSFSLLGLFLVINCLLCRSGSFCVLLGFFLLSSTLGGLACVWFYEYTHRINRRYWASDETPISKIQSTTDPCDISPARSSENWTLRSDIHRAYRTQVRPVR